MRPLETGQVGYIRESELVEQPDFHAWSARFQDRQKDFPNNSNDISLTFASPALISLLSDLHLGHPSTNYKRVEDELTVVVNTPNSYVIFVGDLINNMNWNPGQFDEMEQTPEQISYLKSIFKYLTDHDKLLHSIQGDHDGWLTKAGYNVHDELTDKGVSVSNGPTYFHLDVAGQKYDMGGAHQLPGHSIYNVNHPQMRAVRFGSMHGADVVFSCHNHKKGVAKAYQHELGKPKEVTYIALGPYKATDEWLAKKGWPEQSPEEMFGVSIYLNSLIKEVETDLDIVRANGRVINESGN